MRVFFVCYHLGAMGSTEGASPYLRKGDKKMEKRNFKIVVMIAVVISCMLLSRGAVAFASSNEQVKRNVNEIVRILKETGRTEGLCKRLDYNLYTPNGPIETWIAYIESSNTLRMSMSHTTPEGVHGDIWIEYYIDRNQAEPGWVMLTMENAVAIFTSDDCLNMATAYEDNMNLSWKQSGKYVWGSTAESVNSIFGFSLNAFNIMLNNLFGMQLGDIGFARYPSNIPEYVAPKEEVKAEQEEKQEEKEIEKVADKEDDVSYDNSSDIAEMISKKAAAAKITGADAKADDKKVGLNKTKVSLYLDKGKSVKLSINGAESKGAKWSTSNKSVAKVSKSGKVTGLKAGKATITCNAGGKKYKCKVSVFKSEKNEKKDLVITETGGGATVSEYDDEVNVNFCAMVHNPNKVYAAEFTKILLTVRDKNGTILTTETIIGSYIMPGDTVPVCGSFYMPKEDLNEGLSFEVEAECSDLVKKSFFYKNIYSSEFTISNVSKRNTEDEYYVTGEITNDSDYDLDSVYVTMIMRESGRIVYTDTTYVDKMPSDKTRAFKFENYDPWPEHDKVEFYGGGR